MKIFGLVGFPLTHSWSARYFTEKFEKEGITDQAYQLFPLQVIAGIKGLILKNPDLQGFNVTIPHKVSILPILDDTDQHAIEIGAVNTVKIYREGRAVLLKGFNTDAEGFLKSLPEQLNHRKALVLGTGGAAKAVAWGLRQRGIAYLFVSRTKKLNDTIQYEELDQDLLSEHTFIINTTPVGMFPGITNAPPLPYHLLDHHHFLYDLVYNPEETIFLRQGKQCGAQTLNGLPMLINQAEAAYRIFTSD